MLTRIGGRRELDIILVIIGRFFKYTLKPPGGFPSG